jgi:hypothetical protein
LLLDLDPTADARTVADEVGAAADGWSDSVVAENTMATRWFDGESDLGGRPAWSHLWDQCFRSVEQYETHRSGDSLAARVEAAIDGRSTEVVYVPEPA